MLAPATPPPALAATMLRDRDVARCARESGKTPQAYLAAAFPLRALTLHSGERMIVAVATDDCLAFGAAVKIEILERVAGGYRLVLDDVTLAAFAKVKPDGTALLPTHETMETILESVYVWNGQSYIFSPARSHVYDVGRQQRRPYEIPVRFPPGTFETTLRGTIAYNVSDRYAIWARAGQVITIEITRRTDPAPFIGIWYDEDLEPLKDGIIARWSRKLRKTGSYLLFVSGSDERNPDRVSPYALRLVIR